MIRERARTLVGTNFNLCKCIEIRVSVVPESWTGDGVEKELTIVKISVTVLNNNVLAEGMMAEQGGALREYFCPRR